MPDPIRIELVRSRNEKPQPDTSGIQLPPGYTLEGEAAPAAAVQLPAGYKLDTNTGDDALISQFGFNPEEIKKSPRYQENLQRYGSGLQFLLTDPKRDDIVAKLADSPLGDLGMGALDLFTGVHQLGIHAMNKLGMVPDADAQYIDLVNRLVEEDYKQNVRHGNSNWFARLLGNAALPAGPGATGWKSAMAGGAIGAATQPVTSGDPNSFGSEKLKQTVAGAAAGPVVYGAAKTVGKGIGKAVNAFMGTGLDPESAALLKANKDFGIRSTYGDDTREPFWQKWEQRMEDMPFSGMGSYRKGQHDEARAAANQFAGQLQQAYKAIRPSDFSDVQLAAKEGDDYARKLVEQIVNAGEDPDKLMQVGIGLQNFRTKKEAERLYNKVQERIEKAGLGDADVPIVGIRDVLKWSLNQAESAVVKNKPLINLLKDISGEIQGRENNFARLRQFRSDINRIIRTYRKNDNGIIGEEGVEYLERLRSAIEGDLQYFVDATEHPEIQQAARNADNFYKKFRVPFKDPQLAYAATDTEPDQIFQRFMKPGKGDRAQKFYNAMDAKGQASARYEMIEKAIDFAFDRGKQIFSPVKFFGFLDNLNDATNVFFRGEGGFELEGLKRIMSRIGRAGQYAENPPTGNRMVGLASNVGAPIAAVIGAAKAPFLTGLGVGTYATYITMSRFLLTTDAGKRFLLSASMLPPNSPALQRLINEITEASAEWAGKAAGQATQKK